MLKGFEEQTAPLNEYEMSLLPVLIAGLKTKIGVDYAITNDDMIKALKKLDYKVNQSRIRKMINHIRINNLIPRLISTSKGYYITESKREFDDYKESLRGRINAIQAVHDAMKWEVKPVRQADLFQCN